MTNPNNCTTCDYTKLNGNREGHCYMFREAPTDVCMVHTGRSRSLESIISALGDVLKEQPDKAKSE